MNEIEQLQKAIAALEGQRTVLGDSIVETAIRPLQERLDALQPQPAEQRKQITVLFADLVNFTALSEKLDPEDVREVLNLVFQRWSACIEAHGGQVEKYIGDAVMAVFGLHQAREDDPESAIRAALAMRDALVALNQELEVTRRLRLSMRIGVNTGPVVVSFLAERKGQAFVVVGDTINLASRLQSSASVDGILVSHDTYRHVRGLFAVQPQPLLKVRGKTDPIQVYLVEWAKQRGFRMVTRGIEGIETRTIGRDNEIQHLQDALAVSMQTHQQFVTVVGDAGMGKSRLMYEFDNYMELLPEVLSYLKGRALPSTQSIPYALMRDLFSFRLRLQDSDSPAVVQAKWERGFLKGYGFDPTADLNSLSEEARIVADKSHFVAHLLGFDFRDSPALGTFGHDAKVLQERAVQYLIEYFRTVANRLPVVLLLEDIHWADDASLDLIEKLAHSMVDQRILFVCTARPTLFETRPAWGTDFPYPSRLNLQPLSRRDSRRLVDELLQKMETIPSALRELIVQNAEGNPFYMEELIKMFLDDGAILRQGQQWMLDESRLASLRVPPTLTGVLQARFDSLRLEERVLLQRASVIGRIFWDNALEYLAEQEPGPAGRQIRATPEVLTSLQAREMIYQRTPSSFDNTTEFFFKTTLLRDVTYESLLKRERKLYHAHVARWLEQMTQKSERVDEYAAVIGDHFEGAGELVLAGEWYERAGIRAADQFANRDAVRYLSHALELTPPEAAEVCYRILLAREKVYNLTGSRAEQAQDLKDLIHLGEKLGPKEHSEALRRQGTMEAATGDYSAATASASRAIELARQAGAKETEAMAYLLRGMTTWKKGDYPGAQAPLEQALEIARHEGLSWVEVESLRNLGIVYEVMGEYPRAHHCFEHALLTFRKMRDRRGESMTLNSLGLLAYSQGKFSQALEVLENSLRIKREIGDRRGEETTLHNLGMVAYCMADPVRAGDYFLQSLRIALEINDREGEATCASGLAAVAIFQGDFETAHHQIQQALLIFNEIDDLQGESESLASLSLLLHLTGENEAAYATAQRAYSLASEVGAPGDQSRALNYWGHAAMELGRLEEAQSVYQKALEIRSNLGQQNLAMEPMAGLARTALRQNHLEQALEWTHKILAHLKSEQDGFIALYGVDEPSRIYLSVWKVLTAVKDNGQADTILEATKARLQARAASIPDEALRRLYLENIPAHRELMALQPSLIEMIQK